jgi:hypothetical protein
MPLDPAQFRLVDEEARVMAEAVRNLVIMKTAFDARWAANGMDDADALPNATPIDNRDDVAPQSMGALRSLKTAFDGLFDAATSDEAAMNLVSSFCVRPPRLSTGV